MSLILYVLDGKIPPARGGGGPALGRDVLMLEVADGSSRLLDLDGRLIGLASGATRLLSRALEVGPDAAAREAADRSGVPGGRVRRDLDALLATLRRGRFLRDDGTGARPDRADRPGRLVRAILRRLLNGVEIPAWRVAVLLALAWVSFRAIGWPRTVALWDASAGPESNATAVSGEAADPVEAIDAAVVRAVAGHPLPVACKEKALVSWTLLKHRGRTARLVLGVALYPFRLHAWCEAGGRRVADHADRCAAYDPVRIYH